MLFKSNIKQLIAVSLHKSNKVNLSFHIRYWYFKLCLLLGKIREKLFTYQNPEMRDANWELTFIIRKTKQHIPLEMLI